MRFYRKKPVFVFAEQWDGMTLAGLKNMTVGCNPECFINVEYNEGVYEVYITTLEGKMKLNVGDWLIRGVHNELYPCKDSVFRETYYV